MARQEDEMNWIAILLSLGLGYFAAFLLLPKGCEYRAAYVFIVTWITYLGYLINKAC